MMQEAADISIYYRIIHGLRYGNWLTSNRMRAVAILLLVEVFILGAYVVATSEGYVDASGEPLGTDFSNIYVAGTFVLEGEPATPYDHNAQFQREKEFFGERTGFYAWLYPPYLLSIAALLALLPYGWALIVWQVGTFIPYIAVIMAILKDGIAVETKRWAAARPLVVLLVASYPAVFVNIGHGHNGFLTCALLAGGLWLLDRRPYLAGILFGLLIYKPQFGLMIPLVLAVTGRWRSFLTASATVCLLTGLMTVLYGIPIWEVFYDATHYTRNIILEQGMTGWYKIQSMFSWVRMWGGSIGLAYTVQTLSTVSLGALLVWLWRSDTAFAMKAAGLCVATVLATPYALDYDLMVLAPAIAYFVADGLSRGFRPWEKTVLALLWITPFVTRTVANQLFIPLGVIMMLVVFAMIIRRARIGVMPVSEEKAAQSKAR